MRLMSNMVSFPVCLKVKEWFCRHCRPQLASRPSMLFFLHEHTSFFLTGTSRKLISVYRSIMGRWSVWLHTHTTRRDYFFKHTYTLSWLHDYTTHTEIKHLPHTIRNGNRILVIIIIRGWCFKDIIYINACSQCSQITHWVHHIEQIHFVASKVHIGNL